MINSGLNIGWNSLVVSDYDAGTSLFAGTSAGVFRSTDIGASWIAVNTGLIPTSAGGFALTSTDLYGITNNGIWRRPLSDFNSHTIVASTGDHGSITPLGVVSLRFGENQTYTITSDPEYHVDSLIVDGVN